MTTMDHPFLVSEQRLNSLRATHQGRVSLGGFNYQASFAIMRMASMVTRRSLNFDGVPTMLRYDWGEDLDERCGDKIVFNQCKKVSDIGQAASMAGVLLGFAPKLLWTGTEDRSNVRFRLVCTDQRFSAGGRLSENLADSRDETRGHFLKGLSSPANDQSDRACWQEAADHFGHEALFEQLWGQTDAIFLSDAVDHDHPAGPVLEAEREALRGLMESSAIDAAYQKNVVARLRSVLHENLIEFDPASKTKLDLWERTPRIFHRKDILLELFEYKRHDGHEGQRPPFQVVTRAFLQDQRMKAKQPYVARPPEWSDVVHGTDEIIKFIERDQTQTLRQSILDDLVEPIRRGTSQQLPVKFVLGPPGSGKSTIVRRVVATLVQDGHIVAADAGVYVDNASDPGLYRKRLEELAREGKPILLILDDPLYADSDWPDFLRKMAGPGNKIAVLAASPTFLYEKHKHQLKGRIRKTEFTIAKPSYAEQRELDRLYGYTSTGQIDEEDDFLVLAMQRAAGVSFDEIIERLWVTLNNGESVNDETEFKDYPWEVRAFLLTCFFHRLYVSCPEPIIRAVLERSGGIASGGPVTDALAQLTHQNGWAVFRIKVPEVHQRFSFIGNQVSAAHQRIAERAWELRPAPWRNFNKLIAQGTIDAPEALRAVGDIAVIIGQAGDEGLVNELVETWSFPDIETRYAYDLLNRLTDGSFRSVAKLVTNIQTHAVASADGWLAAIALFFASAEVERDRTFPPSIDLPSLIESADFSIAPTRAVKLSNRLKPSEIVLFEKRLFECLDGKLAWAIDSSLLCWLLSNTPISESRLYFTQITKWLDDHPEATDVRVQYLTYLMRLPDKEFANERRLAAEKIARWLDDYPEVTDVRVQYLTYLMKLPVKEFANERRQAAEKIAQWLDDHPEDTSVRAQFLAYLMKLPDIEFANERRLAAEKIAQWLDDHLDDTFVRGQFLTYLMKLPNKEFVNERRLAAEKIPQWLDDHPEDTNVRTQFLAYLMKLPDKEFVDERRQAAEKIAKWLDDHPEDTNVRTQFLAYMTKLPGKEFEYQRQQLAEKTAQWLDHHPDADNVFRGWRAFRSKNK